MMNNIKPQKRKNTLRFTLTDAILNIPIAEQIIKLNTTGKWKISKADVKNFIKKATKKRKFNVLITDGRAMYKSIAQELNDGTPILHIPHNIQQQ